MKTASLALQTYLATQRAARDAPLLMADCYTLTLRSGTILTYTNADVPIALNGFTYAANAVLIDGLTFKCTIGLDVDEQHITIAARPTDTIGGVPVLVALHHGILDGCMVQRERAFLTSWSAAPIGSVVLFKGRVTSVDSIGRTSADVTVASDLILLAIDMPRNFYQPTCAHTLYDSGCGLVKGAYGTAGTVGPGTTASAIAWSDASALFAQGTLLFTSGGLGGTSVGIKGVAGATLALAYPLSTVPAVGDGFTAYQGCDHTSATCKAKFNNLANFRGFPFVPPPTSAYESGAETCESSPAKRGRGTAEGGGGGCRFTHQAVEALLLQHFNEQWVGSPLHHAFAWSPSPAFGRGGSSARFANEPTRRRLNSRFKCLSPYRSVPASSPRRGAGSARRIIPAQTS